MKRFSMAMTWLALAGLMTTVSCRKPVVGFTNGEARTVTVSAVTESGGGSKTAIDGLNVKWSEKDQIKMNGCVLELKEGAGTTEGVFEGTVTGEAPYYVGYPKEYISYDADPLSFSINIPATMTYAAAKQIVPMAAVTNSVEGGLQFHNAVNMLKLQLRGDDTDASKLTSIVLTSTTSNLSGDINVTFNGGVPEFAAIADADRAGKTTMTVLFGDGLQLTEEATCVYIPLAKINGGDLTVRFDCANGKYMEKKATVTADFNGVNNMLSAPELTVNATEGGAPTSVFSVSASQKVVFSPGNLVATIDASGNPTAWKFAAKQYVCVGANGANLTIGTAAGDVDLFGWSTNANNYGISMSSSDSDYSGDFVDWGGNVINGYAADTWRTLTYDEWTWLLGPASSPNPGTNCRTSSTINGNENARFAYVKVNDVCGVMVFPDVFTWPSDVTTQLTVFNNSHAKKMVMEPTPHMEVTYWNNVNYTIEEFEKLEQAGVVFLPYGGWRDTNPSLRSDCSMYYTSTKNPTDSRGACCFSFGEMKFLLSTSTMRTYGESVRLVRNVSE